MASVQKDEFGQDLTGVQRSYTCIYLPLTYQKAGRTPALPTVMLRISGCFTHFEEVAKPLSAPPGIKAFATKERKGV